MTQKRSCSKHLRPMTDHQRQDLIPRTTLTQVVANRDAALEAYGKFFDALDAAQVHLKAAQSFSATACGGRFRTPHTEQHVTEVVAFKAALKTPNPELLRRTARRLTDIAVWGYLIEFTELEVLMDREEKDSLRKDMAYVPERVDPDTGALIDKTEIAQGLPEITEDNVLATIQDFYERSGEIFRRGIARAFSALDRKFRSHDGFKIGTRLILSYAFNEFGSWRWGHHHRETLLDIERVFLILDGRKPTAAYAGVVGTVEAERQEGSGPRRSCHHGDYFEIRIFKNGNAHLWMRRPDLVKKVNHLLAEYYGAALAHGEDENEEPSPFTTAMDRALAKNLGFFPTPEPLVEKVIEAAELWSLDPLSILEPSAGTGSISSRAVNPYPKQHYHTNECAKHHVTAIELDPERAKSLAQDGRYRVVYARDFLTVTPNGKLFDRVLMNPPFDRDRDIDHVVHAISFLKPGGILVAIMSASTEFAESRKALALRKQVDAWRGRFMDLPEDSFKESGTHVNTVLLTLTRPLQD